MILKALYDNYQRCDDLPAFGLEEKEIGFLLVLSEEGKFLRFEDCRIDKNHARTYLVKKHVGRSSAAVANYLYDASQYVFGYSSKETAKEQLYFDTFKEKVKSIQHAYPGNRDMRILVKFYEQDRETIIEALRKDPLWEEVTKSLTKKYAVFSFRIDGDTEIVAQKKELLQSDAESLSSHEGQSICLITGYHGVPVEITTATMIAGSQAIAKLVAFQVNSGYDSYGKKQCGNAPISEEAEFAYTTALNRLLRAGSHNKFMLGNRTFVFWASSRNEASLQAEDSLFSLLGWDDTSKDDPNAKIDQVRKVFTAIYSGTLQTDLDDRFYILGLAPNSARIAVVYWAETTLRDFAQRIICHFQDMEVIDTRPQKKPYMGIKEMLSAVTMGGKQSEVVPNLPEAVMKSIFQGLPYPYTLYAACIRRIQAEQQADIRRIAILKAYLNRLNDNNLKLNIMLDSKNNNPGYICGRLFAVLDKIQYDANGIHSMKERYMNAASTTPATVFGTLLNLSSHHAEKLSEGSCIYYEKIKQEIISLLDADGFPAHLDLQDQGRFFVGYYHQMQALYTKKEETIKE